MKMSRRGFLGAAASAGSAAGLTPPVGETKLPDIPVVNEHTLSSGLDVLQSIQYAYKALIGQSIKDGFQVPITDEVRKFIPKDIVDAFLDSPTRSGQEDVEIAPAYLHNTSLNYALSAIEDKEFVFDAQFESFDENDELGDGPFRAIDHVLFGRVEEKNGQPSLVINRQTFADANRKIQHVLQLFSGNNLNEVTQAIGKLEAEIRIKLSQLGTTPNKSSAFTFGRELRELGGIAKDPAGFREALKKAHGGNPSELYTRVSRLGKRYIGDNVKADFAHFELNKEALVPELQQGGAHQLKERALSQAQGIEVNLKHKPVRVLVEAFWNRAFGSEMTWFFRKAPKIEINESHVEEQLRELFPSAAQILDSVFDHEVSKIIEALHDETTQVEDQVLCAEVKDSTHGENVARRLKAFAATGLNTEDLKISHGLFISDSGQLRRASMEDSANAKYLVIIPSSLVGLITTDVYESHRDTMRLSSLLEEACDETSPLELAYQSIMDKIS